MTGSKVTLPGCRVCKKHPLVWERAYQTMVCRNCGHVHLNQWDIVIPYNIEPPVYGG